MNGHQGNRTNAVSPHRTISLRDPRVLGAAGVGAVALVALVVRSRGGAGITSSVQPGQGGVLGSLDTSGTDAYNNFAATLSQYQSEITALQDQLGRIQSPAPQPTQTATGLPGAVRTRDVTPRAPLVGL